MNHLKLYESFQSDLDISIICKKYNINDYTINSDGTVDVDNLVYLHTPFSLGLSKLPLKFGKVSRYFKCDNNILTSLEGAPDWVGYNFSCMSNKLTSLEGGPNYVGGHFYCHYNQIRSFEGAPKHIHGEFDCYHNPIYEIWELFWDYSKIELFNDYDIIRDGDEKNDTIVLGRLNSFLMDIGKEPVKTLKGYKCI